MPGSGSIAILLQGFRCLYAQAFSQRGTMETDYKAIQAIIIKHVKNQEAINYSTDGPVNQNKCESNKGLLQDLYKVLG